MATMWAWVVGTIMAVCIVALLVYGRADRADYWAAKTAPVYQGQATPEPVHRLPPSFYRR